MKYLLPFFSVFFFSLVLSGCGSSDVTLLNEVKRFEPEWTRLSATVTTVKSNLALTEAYESHLSEIEPYLSQLRTSTRSDLADMRSRYRNMMVTRDTIRSRYQKELIRFEEEVSGFNNWVNDLMQENVDQQTARVTFDQYERTYGAIRDVMDELYHQTVSNIEMHNMLMRRMAAAVKLYGNYEISVR